MRDRSDDTEPRRGVAFGPRSARRAWITAALAVALGCGAELPAKPNVVVFVIDAARVDHVGAYGYARDTTPSIDRFAASATRYDNAVAEGSFTFASVSSLFSGRSPSETGLLKARPLDPEVALLPEVARDAGYRTRGYSENPFVSDAFGFDRGFDAFDAPLSHAAWERAPKEFAHSDPTDAIADLVAFASEPSDAPFFLYVHVLRPHNPYAPPEGFAGRFGSGPPAADGSTRRLFALDRRGRAPPERLANIVALYDENLAAADAAFGALVDGLRARDLLDETIVVLLSDHGEAFLEHDRLLHGSTTYDEMIRIPLVVGIPGRRAEVVDRSVQLADVGVALRDVLAGRAGAVDGLASLGRARAAPTLSFAMLAERRVAARTDARKVVLDLDTLEPVASYDLVGDPAEQAPLPLDADARRLAAFARARVEGGHPSLRRPADVALDPTVRARLEALGYAGEGGERAERGGEARPDGSPDPAAASGAPRADE